MTENIKDYARGMRSRVRLLANTASVVAYVPPWRQHLLEANPGLSVDLEERPSSGIVEALVHERAESVSPLMLRTFSHFKRVSSRKIGSLSCCTPAYISEQHSIRAIELPIGRVSYWPFSRSHTWQPERNVRQKLVPAEADFVAHRSIDNRSTSIRRRRCHMTNDRHDRQPRRRHTARRGNQAATAQRDAKNG
ncbi:hypothetical protein OKW28_000176 [Paraburkholderia sp. 40]